MCTLRRICVYWRCLQFLINRRILGHTPCTPHTTYIREWPELGACNFVTTQAQPIAIRTLTPCRTLQILLVHSRSGVVPFTCMMAFPLSTLRCDAAEWVSQSSDGSHHNLCKSQPLILNLAAVANQLLSMHTTACAPDRDWSKWGLMFAKNRARLGIERASIMIFLSENHVFTEFSEAELLDLSLEDDA